MPEDTLDGGEYTRFKAKIQLGDGPDRRGEVTVETVRERTEDDTLTVQNIDMPGNGNGDVTGEVSVNHDNFGEWYLELSRARRALVEQLDLEEE